MKTRAKLSTFMAAILFALTATVAATVTTAPAFAQEASAPASTAAASAPEAAAATEASNPAADASLPSAEVKKEPEDDPYSFKHLALKGHLVDQATLVIMGLMSMFTWYILITKIIDLTKLNGQAKEGRKFWQAANVGAGVSTLKEGSPYRYIAESGINASQHHDGALLDQIDLNSWVTMSIQRSVEKVQSRLGEGLTFLATVGSTAPFIGLFGTVMGIYNALIQISASGSGDMGKVAGPVGSALIMTAIGLATAVPAVLGYNYLLRRNKAAMDDIRAFGADLHAVVLSGAMSKASANK